MSWIKTSEGLPELHRKLWFVQNKNCYSQNLAPEYNRLLGEIKFQGFMPYFVTDCKQFALNEVPYYQYAELPALPE